MVLSRIGELISLTSEAAKEAKFLIQNDLDFFLASLDDGTVTIYITILSKWIKNHTRNDRFKRFVVYFLSPHLVFQDTYR